MQVTQNFEWKPKNPEFETFIREKLKRQHFMRHIGFDLTTIQAGYIEGEAPLEPFMTQQDGFVHGGVTATLSDIVTGFAAFSLVEKDQRVVSAELSISYFRPGSGQKIFARGWVVKPGSRLHFCEGLIWTVNNGESTTIAKVNSVMAVFRPGESGTAAKKY